MCWSQSRSRAQFGLASARTRTSPSPSHFLRLCHFPEFAVGRQDGDAFTSADCLIERRLTRHDAETRPASNSRPSAPPSSPTKPTFDASTCERQPDIHRCSDGFAVGRDARYRRRVVRFVSVRRAGRPWSAARAVPTCVSIRFAVHAPFPARHQRTSPRTPSISHRSPERH